MHPTGAKRHGILWRLQQMRADAFDFFAKLGAGARYRSARHGHAARCERAHSVRRNRAVPVPHDDIRDGDSELLGRDLRERGFEPLAVVLDADEQDQLAVWGEARERGLVAEYDGKAARDPFGGAMGGLLGVAREPDADHAAVRLAALLPCSHLRHIDGGDGAARAFGIVAAVVELVGGGAVRHR